jgi:membrane protein required for colicin V production
MNWLDLVIIGIIAISAVISLFRGFTKEAISLGTWILAFWLALAFSTRLAAMLPDSISSPTARIAVAFAGLFVLTVILGGIVNFLISSLVEKTGLTGTDRSLGVIFGIVRGALLVVILTLLAGLTTLPRERAWENSLMIGKFEQGAVWLKGYVPESLAKEISF